MDFPEIKVAIMMKIILEFQGLDTKELPADAMVSSSGGNFSYLSSSGEHTFSTASYGLKFKNPAGE